MAVRQVVVAAVVLLLLLAPEAMAQGPAQQPTNIQIQYHEFVPADGDSTPVFLRIFDHIRKDCELVGKAFARKCTISQINIYTNPNNSGEMAGAKIVNATATMTLPADAAGASPLPPPSK